MFELLDVVGDLNSVICEKDKEIETLKLVIKDRDETINCLKKDINIGYKNSEYGYNKTLKMMETKIETQYKQIKRLEDKLAIVKNSWNTLINAFKEE